MTLSSYLENIDVLVHHVSVKFKINSPQPIVCDLAIDLEGQDHILFPMIDYVGVHVKINSLVSLPIVTYHYLSAFVL